MTTCPGCGRSVPDGADVCPACGLSGSVLPAGLFRDEPPADLPVDIDATASFTPDFVIPAVPVEAPELPDDLFRTDDALPPVPAHPVRAWADVPAEPEPAADLLPWEGTEQPDEVGASEDWERSARQLDRRSSGLAIGVLALLLLGCIGAVLAWWYL